jgi:UPF0271 protein
MKSERQVSISIDLNADLGEGYAWDAELLSIVSSCNIACGGHSGDTRSMQATVGGAIANDVAIGAHISYPDREGFGRRSRFLSGDALFASLVGQLRDLRVVCDALGTSISHVKPHGALYGDAAADSELASIIVRSINDLPENLSLVGPPDGELAVLAQTTGTDYINEAFVDRSYLPDGRLVPRSDAGAVHTDLDVIASQAVSIAVRKRVCSLGGEIIPVLADTLCIHGDTPGAAAAARRVRDALQQEGVVIRAIGC